MAAQNHSLALYLPLLTLYSLFLKDTGPNLYLSLQVAHQGPSLAIISTWPHILLHCDDWRPRADLSQLPVVLQPLLYLDSHPSFLAISKDKSLLPGIPSSSLFIWLTLHSSFKTSPVVILP